MYTLMFTVRKNNQAALVCLARLKKDQLLTIEIEQVTGFDLFTCRTTVSLY